MVPCDWLLAWRDEYLRAPAYSEQETNASKLSREVNSVRGKCLTPADLQNKFDLQLVFPRIDFLVTNLTLPSRIMVRFYKHCYNHSTTERARRLIK